MPKEFTLDGEIGWSIGTWDVKNILREAKGEDIKINFASPGGSALTGLKIYNLFKMYKGNVDFHLIGEAASMGSYIPLSASGKITAAPNVVFMIHNARSIIGGDHHAMRKRADIVEGLSNILRNEYAKRTGNSETEIAKQMNEETFFFGEDAVKAGFIDEIVGEKDIDPDAKLTYIALAKESFEACMTKLNEEMPDDYEKAAAIMTRDFEARSEHEDINPADAENTKEEVSMNLIEAMEKYPAIKAEVEGKVSEASRAGIKIGKDSMSAIMKKTAVAFNPESNYPASIRTLAIKVQNGESDVTALEACITMHDANEEEKKSAAALLESKGSGGEDGDGGETHQKQKDTKVSEDGSVNSEADFQANLARIKKGGN